MARYTGPKTKKARSFGEPIFGYSKAFEKKKYPPGQHGNTRRRRQKSDYALQLMEKQKAKYTYGVLERQFRNLFETASSKKGVTGEVLLQLLEARLDNTVFPAWHSTFPACCPSVGISQAHYGEWCSDQCALLSAAARRRDRRARKVARAPRHPGQCE